MRANDQLTNSQLACETEELWYRVPGFESEVYVSDQGQVLVDGSIRKLDTHNPGKYNRVMIQGKKYGVHQLVGFVMRGEQGLDGLVPHHENGDPQDNRFENIRLVSPAINEKKSHDRRLINQAIRDAIANGDARVTHLVDVKHRYLEAEFHKQDGNQNDLVDILSKYMQNVSSNRGSISDRRSYSANRANYKGITLEEVKARLMMKNNECTILPPFYHRDNAVKNFLITFGKSHQQEMRLNAKVARNVLTDRVSTLCTAICKVAYEQNLDNILRVEHRDNGHHYLIKV